MPARSNEFQRLVALLTATMRGTATVTESAMLKDAITDESREVDVLISGTAGSYPICIGIEVSAVSRPADVGWVEKMSGKHANLPTDKLILVSESGFTKAAHAKASALRIETLTVEEACEADWPLIAKLESTGTFELLSMAFDVAAIWKGNDGRECQFAIPTSSTVTNRGEQITIDTLVRHLLSQEGVIDVLSSNIDKSPDGQFWMAYTEPDGLWKMEHQGEPGRIQELRVGLKVSRRSTPVQFATGKFRAVPFLAGTATEESDPLQFVLARSGDGQARGMVITSSGVHVLESKQT